STNDLSMVMFKLGQVDEAERRQQEALTIFSRLGDRRAMAFVRHNRGWLALHNGRFDEARRYFLESLEIRRALRHTWAASIPLTQLGIVANAAGDGTRAQAHLLEALRLARDVQYIPAILGALVEVAGTV